MCKNYTRKLKVLYCDQHFRSHPRNNRKAKKADRELLTIAGRLLRKLQRNHEENIIYDELICIFIRVVDQKRNDKDKIYSINDPEMQCISKGKEHKKYELGYKMSVVHSLSGLIHGVLSFRNEYDGQTIEKSLEQVKRLTGRTLKRQATMAIRVKRLPETR